MILVAGNFRKEITSTVMWMLNHDIKVQCFKVTPYEYNKQVLLDIEQIIPVKEAEDYIIKMADKNREEKEVKETNRDLAELRKAFWTELLEEFNKISTQYKNVNPGLDHWLSSGSGVGGCVFDFIVTKNYASVELSISKSMKEENKKIFDILLSKKDEIENAYGSSLLWERLDSKKSSRISDKHLGVDISNREDWDAIKEFLCTSMVKLEKALKDPLKKAASVK